MPALDYLAEGQSQAAAWGPVSRREFTGLWVLTFVFLAVVAVQALTTGADLLSRDLTLRQKWDRFGNLLVDLAVACLLVVSCGVYTAYMVRYAAAFSARQHYTVYDDVERARARWLLPLKTEPAALGQQDRAQLQVGGGDPGCQI
jgi:hypothetical protein